MVRLDMGARAEVGARAEMGARAEVADAAAALQAAGVDMIDMTPTLVARAEADGERLYYWLDIHLTPAGNRVVAQTVAPRLAQLIVGSREQPALP